MVTGSKTLRAREDLEQQRALYERRAEIVAGLAEQLGELLQATRQLREAEEAVYEQLASQRKWNDPLSYAANDKEFAKLRAEAGLPAKRSLIGLPAPSSDGERLAVTVAKLVATGELGPDHLATAPGMAVKFNYGDRDRV